MISFRGLVASGNCWREEQYVRWTKVNFKVLHAAPVQGSHGAFWLAKSSVVVHLFVNLIGRSLFVVHSFFELIRDLFPLVSQLPTTEIDFSRGL